MHLEQPSKKSLYEEEAWLSGPFKCRKQKLKEHRYVAAVVLQYRWDVAMFQKLC